MDIRKEFRKFDGKNLGPVKAAAVQLPAKPASLTRMLKIAADPDERLQVGATWAAKDLLEQGVEAPATLAAELLAILRRVSNNDARLHLLQILPYCSLAGRQPGSLHRLLLPQLESENKFVRAWAFNALALVAKAAPRYREEVLDRFATAEVHESAAVRARIRRARRSL
jgi:HEAT repeat protein